MKFSVILSTISAAVAVLAVPNASEKALYGYATLNGGTTGGIGGATTTVSTLAALTSALADDVARIVWVSGTISGSAVVKVGSNKSILGLSGATLNGVGLRILEKKNVIIRNLKITKVVASVGDAIAVQGTTAQNVWIDHVDLSSDKNNGKDFYDGLLDITHGVKYVTVSYSWLHDHYKGSLVGHSDSNEAEDKAITVTYAYNYWQNLNSRGPSFRFGTGHIYNNYYNTVEDGINTRVGAQLLVENNVWVSSSDAIFADGGFAVARNNLFNGATNTAPTGTLTSVPYSYSTIANSALQAAIVGKAGATL